MSSLQTRVQCNNDYLLVLTQAQISLPLILSFSLLFYLLACFPGFTHAAHCRILWTVKHMMYFACVKQPYRCVLKISLLNNVNNKIKVSETHQSKYDTNSFINSFHGCKYIGYLE